jgi:amino acid transporter
VIYFFGIVGIDDPAQAVAFSLLYVLLGLYAVALVGFFAWLFMPRTLREKLGKPIESHPVGPKDVNEAS